MEFIWLKLAAIAIIVAAGLVGGLLPLRLGIAAGAGRVLAIGNGFAGGVFLGAGLIHMLADAGEHYQAAGGGDFPWPLVITGGGFLLVLLVERVLVKSHDIADSGSGAYPYILTGILSLHSIIAGVALGLEQTLASGIAIIIAILSHKASAAFALVMSLRQANLATSRIKGIIAMFVWMTPMGVLLGVLGATKLTGSSVDLAESLFDAMAAGTFLYVGILEIVNKTFADRRDLMAKFFLLSVGFGIMALLALWV